MTNEQISSGMQNVEKFFYQRFPRDLVEIDHHISAENDVEFSFEGKK